MGIVNSPSQIGEDWKTELLTFGHRDHKGRPYEAETIFHTVQHEHLFVALSMGLLIDNGTLLPNGQTLDYGSKIQDILPDWKLHDEYATAHLDVLDLLSMRSGLPSHRGSYNGEEDPAEMIHDLRYLKPTTEIRQVMQFNRHHYWVLSEIIQKLTSTSLPEFIQTHFWDTLDMTLTSYNRTEAVKTGKTAGAFEREGYSFHKCKKAWAQDGKLSRACYGYPVPVEWYVKGDGWFVDGPAGIVSSIDDMMKWLRELLGPKVIPAHVLAKTHECIIPAFGRTAQYDERGMPNCGHGQVTYTYRGHELIQYVGLHPGAGSTLVRAPALGIGIVLIFNDEYGARLLIDPIIYRVLDDILGLDPIDWEDRTWKSLLPNSSKTVDPPAEQRPAPNPDKITGSYHDPGYGSLNISTFDNFPDFELTSSELLAAFENFNPDAPKPTYVALMSNVFSRGLILTHFDGPMFNATRIEIATKLEDGKAIPILHGSYTAVFVEGVGVGMFGNFWDGIEGRDAVEDGVEAEAEVWFVKI